MENKTRGWALRLVWVVLAATVIFFGFRLYYRLTDDFRLANITYEMPYNPAWEAEPLTDKQMVEVSEALDQPFHYIGKGAQSYAFLSEDGQHVLKFFKFKHLKPNWLVRILPDSALFEEYKTSRSRRKKRLINSVFNGYKLAYDVHRDESALVYIHLNPTDNLKRTIVLYDKIGWKHQIDLDTVVFVLQKRVQTSRRILGEALESGNVDLALQRLDQIISLYLLEYSKGIYDRDHGLMHNTGFAEGKAIHLDVGKLSSEPAMKEGKRACEDLVVAASRCDAWLAANYPQHRLQMMALWEKRIRETFGETVSFVEQKN